MSDAVEIFKSEKLKLSVSKFGQLKDPQSEQCVHVQKFTWETTNRLTFEVITLDAAIVGLAIPDRNFDAEEVLLASGTLDTYLHYDEQRLSASVQSAPLKRRKAWSQRIWSPYVNGSDLILTNVVLEECRNLMIRVRFSVAFNNVIRINYEVVSDRVQPLDTSHRLVLNLGGKSAAHFGTYDHVVQLDAERFCRVKGNHLRDSVEKPVAEDLADLRVAQHVGMAVYRSEKDGFDGVYKLSGTLEGSFNTRLIHARTGRVMEMYSDFEWLRFSTLNDLPNPAGQIAPFYASLGVKDVGQIFDLNQLLHSVVRFVEGDDVESEPSETDASLVRLDTITESQARVMIDDMLLKDLEEKIQALKEAGILNAREAREIIEDLLIMSLGRMSESGLDLASVDGEGVRDVIEDLLTRAISETTLNQESSLTKESSSTLERISTIDSSTSEVVEEPQEVPHEYQKHAGILLHPCETLSLRRCKQKSLFSKPNYNRELVYKHNVLLKFGICRGTPSNNSEEDASKSNSTI